MSDTEKELDEPKAEIVASWFAGKPRAPYYMEVSPITACNVNCRFCRKKAESADYYRRAKDLSDDRWYEILEKAVEMGTRRIFFRGGGEPLLKRRLLTRMFPLIAEKEVVCTLLTNGTLIDEALAEGFVRSGWNEIIFSLHGGDAETHDYITDLPGSFARVTQALERLNRFKSALQRKTPYLSFHVVLTRRSFRQIDRIIELAKAHGVGNVGVFPMHNAPYPEFVQDLEMREEDKRQYRELVPKYKDLLDSYGISHDFQITYQDPPQAAAPAQPPSGPPQARVPCYFPWFYATITPNGFISPCCYGEGAQTKGDLHRVSFEEAWFHQDMGEVRESLLSGRLMPYCAKCPNWYQSDNRRLREVFAKQAAVPGPVLRNSRITVPEEVKRKTLADCASGVVFDWNFHVACNYRCPYCIFHEDWKKLAGLNRLPALDGLQKAWGRIHEDLGECYVTFNGGEPTVYPQFAELMSALGRWHRWNFNTNLSWDIPPWESFAKQVDMARGSVQLSYHPTEDPDFAGFLRRALFVQGLGLRNCSVCIVAYPPHLKDLPRYCRELKSEGLITRVQPMVGSYEGRRYPAAYTAEERRLIDELNQETRSALSADLDYAMGDQSPRGRPCRSGQSYFHINQLGDVYRCTQVPQKPELRLGSLVEGFAASACPRPCPMDFCPCGESRWLVEGCG
ncbi:MAG: radical SAM protein [Elusimicrobia bacterium]|nr:radical SAM protein [Elusimicrobiota bacterium]